MLFILNSSFVARHLGYRRFFEASVWIEHHFGSTISLRSVGSMLPGDTFAIFYRLRLLRSYDRASAFLFAPPSTDVASSALGGAT